MKIITVADPEPGSEREGSCVDDCCFEGVQHFYPRIPGSMMLLGGG